MALYWGNKKVSLYLGDKRVKLSISPSGVLPTGYTQLSYIESSGPQYINTQINGTDVTRFRIKAYATAAGSSNTQVLGGVASGVNSFFGIRIIQTVANWYPLDSEDKNLVPQTAVALTDATIVKGVSQTGTITNVTTNTEFQFAKFSVTPTSWAFPNEPLLLFGGASNRRVPVGRCYGLELYTAEGLVRNLIPACRNSDNTVGMYDTVSGTFFTNAGTGEFKAGYILPDGYTQLNYIESTGTQYIDTGISGFNDGDWDIYAKWLATNTTQTAYAAVLSVYESENTNAYRIIFANTNINEYYVNSNSKAGSSVKVSSAPAGVIHTATLSNGSFVFDGVTYQETAVGTALHADASLYIFRLNTTYLKGRIYNLWAKKDGILKTYLVPAVRNSDNAVGLYDIVRKIFFTNAGTGNFTSSITTSAASLMSLEALSMDEDVPTETQEDITEVEQE